MPYHPTDDNIEWHMGQLRNWMIPNPMPIPQTAPLRSTDAISQHFYAQNVPSIDYYNYDTSAITLATRMPLQRAQTFADLNDFDYNYSSTGYFHSPMTPSSCPPDDLAVSDDVASCFSEAPSSFVSSEMNDKSGFESTHSTTSRHPSVTSQPVPSLLQPPPSEVDALMKNIKPASTGTSPTSSASSVSRVKRHICPYSECGKAFSQPTHLKIHLRSHTGEKPYTCSVPTCRQAFSQLGNLRTHERRHIGQRPNRKRSSSDPGARTKRYECILDGCRSAHGDPSRYGGKVFTQLGNLKAHMNKFHKDTLTRLSQQLAHTEASPIDQELRQYFQDLFKNSNKGIKGRGKGRKVEVLIGEVIQP